MAHPGGTVSQRNVDRRVVLNGIDAETGRYLQNPLSVAEAAALARGSLVSRVTEPEGPRMLVHRLEKFRAYEPDSNDLRKVGWGVIYGPKASAALHNSMAPLVRLREQQVGKKELLQENLVYQKGERASDWLRRYGVSYGDPVVTKVPHHLLLVGGPEEIPFEFQFLLGIEYSVGRISFDTPDEYERYGRSLVAYDSDREVPTSKEISFWGTHHKDDDATAMSATYLVDPLYSGKGVSLTPVATQLNYRSQEFLADSATRSNLLDILHGTAMNPSLVFTASHGMGYRPGSPEQTKMQGALLTQDWTGSGSVQPQHLVQASDIQDDAKVHGLVAFCFACFVAGTPAYNYFPLELHAPLAPLAPEPFVAALPKRLLAHPQGGALAIIGHVERAWGYSISPPGLGPQLTKFSNCLGRIASGECVGNSIRQFSQRYAALSIELENLLAPGAGPISDEDLVSDWIERNDAQSYLILGDPAARLRVADLR